ncbi:aldo/keto reductase [Streptomyces sp. NPDC050804]|uniref:aldo/keto reductase n=1 Tax=unclassified Streptomyces TaxID=2593676 RepID=UPI003413DBA6|nr:aldo/keto reductase [Streptomyces sp. NBC_00872]
MTAALGMGTYRARGVPEAAEAAIRSGVYWIDTAPNYHHGKDEALLAPVLKTHRGVRLSTKVGFLSEPQQDEAVRRRVLTHSEAGQGHSLAPQYVRWQVARSKEALGRTPDVVFLHNPEHGGPSPIRLADRILRAFGALEECCNRGLIKGYGVATWSALHDGSLTVEELVDLARSAGGAAHRLRAIQLPLSLVQLGPLADAVDGYGVLIDARSAGLDVYASAPLHGGELTDIITPPVADELLPGATPLRIILGTVASAPGVTRVLLSASTAKHWSEAAQGALGHSLDTNDLRRITDAFRT